MKIRVINAALIATLSCLTLTANETKTYTQNYSVLQANAASHQNDNRFMYGNFENIYRFEMINFDDGMMLEESEGVLNKILQTTEALKGQNRDFKMTLTSHTRHTTDDKNENAITSDTYADGVIAAFEDEFSSDEAMSLSQKNAQNLLETLVSRGIAKEKIFLEYRAAKDSVLAELEDEDAKLANGVFVAIYVPQKESALRAPKPQTQPLMKESSPKSVTPPARLVDSDHDGVEDAKDECKLTPEGVSVDVLGCPLKSTLKLNFAVNSAEILANSYGEIERFAAFMKANPMYHAQITGHTDSRGKDVLNMKLSQNRALATKAALVKEGVEESRLSTKGRGELSPIASNVTPEGREANRRIEVELFIKK